MLKKGLIAGFLNLLVGLGLNWGVSLVLPGILKEYQNTTIFRPWTDPLMMTYFAYPFILGVALSYLWDLVHKQFKGEPLSKAFEFAKMYFLIATIPGMFISYTSLQLSLVMILLWTATGFLQALIAGLVFAKAVVK